ncbi:lytic transglycosylase domain-containing protein [Candidatus Falkowbacteria bacterium]|nr:lytic transglycosylase domain-containing protein [Candidatus Falkowbacteria bacterium]
MGTSVIPADPTARDSYDTLLSNADYDCTLLKAVMFAESSGRPNITSSAGAVGLMQVMPSTAQSLGVNGNLYDPQTNINVGAKYLTQLSSTACNGSSNNSICRASDIKYVIAAYNGGPLANKESTVCPGKTFWECENNQGYAQTRKYVSTVTANFESLKNNGGDCQ